MPRIPFDGSDQQVGLPGRLTVKSRVLCVRFAFVSNHAGDHVAAAVPA